MVLSVSDGLGHDRVHDHDHDHGRGHDRDLLRARLFRFARSCHHGLRDHALLLTASPNVPALSLFLAQLQLTSFPSQQPRKYEFVPKIRSYV